MCIHLTPDGQETWIERTTYPDYQQLEKTTVLKHIRDAGIAGMGGAGFPSVVKLSTQPDQKIEQLILNAVECEPYITADDRLMRERADEIIAGLMIMAWLVEPSEILIGIEDNKPEAIATMQQATANTPAEVVVIPTKYPSGGEKQLIHILTGKEVHSGGIPVDVGVICQNTGTAFAIKRAIIDGEPLISRITTVTGDSVQQKGNYEVLLGTPIRHVLAQAGVQPHDQQRLIMGGPMMGFSVHNPGVPIVKTTNCLLVPSQKELSPPAPEQPCIRCGGCAQACPVSLLPQQLYWFAKTKEFDKAAHFNLADCIECGACSYVCPSHIPLVQYFRYAKGAIRTQEQETQKSNHARIRFEARTARLEQEATEKERKRQERAKAAAAKQKAKKAAPATLTPSKTGDTGSTDLAKLQTAAASTMKRYKDAQKALEQAEKNGNDHLDALQKKVDQLKAKADAAKKAFTSAKTTTSSNPSSSTDTSTSSNTSTAINKAPPDPLTALKKASADDFAAYKAAQSTLAESQAEGDELSALQAKVDALKTKSDESKAAMKIARAKEKDAIQKQNAAKDPEKALKMEVAKCQVLLKKAKKALSAADPANTDNTKTLMSAVQQSEQALVEAEEKLKHFGENA